MESNTGQNAHLFQGFAAPRGKRVGGEWGNPEEENENELACSHSPGSGMELCI